MLTVMGRLPGFDRGPSTGRNRRDLHTVGQTVTLAPEWYPIGGRIYLGLDPGPRLQLPAPAGYAALTGRVAPVCGRSDHRLKYPTPTAMRIGSAPRKMKTRSPGSLSHSKKRGSAPPR